MRIVFRESGGYAPVFWGCELDTATLAAEEAARLAELVAASGILTLKDRQVPRARDVRLFTVRLETDGGTHEVTLDQLSVPDRVRPLLEHLREQSHNLLPGAC